MTIKNIATAQLAEIIAGLVKEGLTFECQPDSRCAGTWIITLTGGY